MKLEKKNIADEGIENAELTMTRNFNNNFFVSNIT